MESSRNPVASDTVPVAEGDDRDVFECQICMDAPKDSVLTTCGHLFCWSCLYTWLQNEAKPCPLCKQWVTKGSITPVYGCQKGNSALVENGSIPPRPSASLAPAPPNNANPDSGSSPWRWRGRHGRIRRQLIDSLWSEAHADFRAIRRLHPPSPTAWIAEASERFDPSVRPRDGDGLRPTEDIQRFISDVLIPHGEYCPGIYDFQRSWLQYYEARTWGITPPRSALQHYDSFLQSWGMHFQEAWDHAGRPNSVEAAPVAEAAVSEPVSEEPQLARSQQVQDVRRTARLGRTSSGSAIHAPAVSSMEVDQLQVDLELDIATAPIARRIVSGQRRSTRIANLRASRRPRP